jgi:predicted acylesterase/phospholipase RssA
MKNNLIVEAQAILEGGNKKPEEILALAKELHEHDEFGWARKILDLAVGIGIDDSNLSKQICQKRALSTYKDTHLNRGKALDLALDILGEEFDLAKIKDQETLGIAGAIYKRKWENDGIKVHLEQALVYYDRGFKAGVKGDDGYTAINAAYILDLLAYLEQKQAGELGGFSSVATKRRKDAKKIREKIIEYLSESLKNLKDDPYDSETFWPMATLAEAYFGTKQYAQAKTWLEKTLKVSEIPEWQYVTMARQLVHLAKLQADKELTEEEQEKTEAWSTLASLLGKKAYALRSMYRGKVGLALSGGGFRASFYHIGVLAKLAELDLLRHIEVLSCVSGGSILGAHYYLELRRLINVEKKEDAKITRDDYIQLVKNLQDDFLAGVQENPRVSLLANPWSNLKIIFASNYSRTQKLGELYEELIYSRIQDGEGDNKRWLNDLYMHPEGEKDFLPRRDNWSRQCKIPELVLNSTTLNTGHNWQFTASWMGESPSQIDPDVDTNDRLRRTYYDEAPDPHKQMRLGSAVGASSCVPGLFEPIIFQGLYQDTTVRLVDGGVYDNQGVASLIEQDCSVIISSDATGQMNTEKDPGGGVLKPLLRTNSTLMQRVRGSQYQDLKARARAGILKGFAYVHLKQGLEGENVDWADSDEPEQTKPNPDAKTDYGIRRDIQELVAGIRTDLDSFSDIEAYALMTSGYCAIEGPVQQYLQDFPLQQGDRPEWKFLKVEATMKQDKAGGEAFDRLKTNLEASTMTFGKVWKLNKTLNRLIKGAGALLLLVLAYIWYSNPGWQPFAAILSGVGDNLTIGMIMWTIVILLIMSLVTTFQDRQAKVVKKALNYRDLPRRILVGAGIGLVGWIGAFIHLRFFDKMFKKIGKVE